MGCHSTHSVALVRMALRRAAGRRGPRHGPVRLVAASKARDAAEIAAACRAGVTDFGENYLQEALPKICALAGRNLTWHFVGAVQSNKTRDIAHHFHWVQTVDRAEVAKRLHRHRAGMPPLNVCIQVNIDAEPAKAGVAPEGIGELAQAVRELGQLRLRGLMAMPARHDAGAASRPSFLRMAALFEAHRPADDASWDTLSMGMSGDYETAVEAGSTCVRIGTAIFGPRPPRSARR